MGSGSFHPCRHASVRLNNRPLTKEVKKTDCKKYRGRVLKQVQEKLARSFRSLLIISLMFKLLQTDTCKVIHCHSQMFNHMAICLILGNHVHSETNLPAVHSVWIWRILCRSQINAEPADPCRAAWWIGPGG